jgi:hypothetical protein
LTTAPRDVAFWSGAGASVAAPTSLPTGPVLTQQVLSNACGDDFARWFIGRIRAAELRDDAGVPKSAPRLESVLQHLIPLLGAEIALAPLRVLEDRPPNALHHLFAEHVRREGRHLTTNFDRCVERALGGESDRIAHLHGTYDPRSLGSLGIEVVELSRGLPDGSRAAIVDALERCSRLVVCGYSGGDYFDVDPFLRELRARGVDLSHLEVVWVDHGPAAAVADPDPVNRRPMVIELRAMGATVTVVRGDTLRLVTEMTQPWSLPVPAAVAGTSAPATAVEAPVTEWQRLRARSAVLRASGMGGAVVALARGVARRPEPEARALRAALREDHAAGLAETGRYRTAAWMTIRDAGRSQPDRAHRDQVIGSYLRLRGNRLLGAWLHRRSVVGFTAGDGRGDAIIEWLNWRRERATTSDGRALGWLGRVEDAVGGRGLDAHDLWCHLAADREYVAAHPHSVAQLQRIHEEVPELRDADVPGHLAVRFAERSSVYFESDSITGYTNTERDALRRLDDPPPEALARLLMRSKLVDDRPGAVKAALLQRRWRQPARFPWRDLALLGWAYPWKLRFVVLWMLRRDWPRN